jgi:flagellar basal body-associated protein FliL
MLYIDLTYCIIQSSNETQMWRLKEMTTSTIIVLVICCFLCPMGMFVTMNSKKNKKDSEDKNNKQKED